MPKPTSSCTRVRATIHFIFAAIAWAAVCMVAAPSCLAQTEAATVSGLVTDALGAVVLGADVQLQSAERGVTQSTVTNGAGIYVFPTVQPGIYQITVRKIGFRQLDYVGLKANVQAHIEQNFQLQVGAASESVTVEASGVNVNALDATVSTVVNGQFLEEIPLNGRSVQTLLLLTPGVVFTEGGASNSQGQFSVNGMRTDSNYFTIDGVAANLGTDQVGNGLGEAAAGSDPGWNALGGTNGLVSVDAIQEFRVQTSSFAPEYGRTPGGQVAFVTRSGSNAWHGSAFDYLRNDLFDATDWFNGYTNNPPLPKPEERQNDFGGVIGGPIIKDHTFFFFSYEGLRLRQPVTLLGVVPDAPSRVLASAALQPFLNAFPKPNGAELADNLASFNTSISNPDTLDAYSIRLDQSIGSKLRFFARYAYSPSATASAGSTGSSGISPNNIDRLSVTTHTFTVGLDETITSQINNELRLNYSNLQSFGNEELTTLGGAVPLSNSDLANIYASGVDPATAQLTFQIGDGSSYFLGPNGVSEQRQLNAVDNFSVTKGSHLLRFGFDIRWLAPFDRVFPYYLSLYFNGMTGPGGVLTGQTEDATVETFQGASTRSRNFSIYAQDSWRVTPRFTLTYGLRWEINPAPHGNSLASDPIVVSGLDDPSAITVEPRGTPFYSTTYGNIAPRLGVAYKLRGSPGQETVVRGGIGRFYDIGSGSLGQYTLGYPFSAYNDFPEANYPLTPEQLAPPTVDPSGPVGFIYVAEPHLTLPRTYQWNVAVEQALGSKQTVTLTYLGTLGRGLLRGYTVYPTSPNFSDDGINVTANTGSSDYHALQIQFQHQVAHGLQVLASYTYSHSIDDASNDWATYSPVALGSPRIDRGNSDFDVRHSASGALTYSLPEPFHGLPHAILGGWSVQNLIFARTAFPVDIYDGFDASMVGPYELVQRFNIVPGVPFYLHGSQYPGGKAFNPAAFTDADPGVQGNLGRNTLRGFGPWQDNFAVHRQFALKEGVQLQFRAEAFNILNHPSFADPDGFWPTSFPDFGLSVSTIANASSFNGQNSLYGIGGPRSWQFGLKLQF